jgi:hypothetical protein
VFFRAFLVFLQIHSSVLILSFKNGDRGFSNLEILLKNQIASLKNYFLNRARDNTFFNALVSADKGDTPLNLSDNICGGREKVGKSNYFKNELAMFTP